MINLPAHTHTQHQSGPNGKTTNHTWTTPNALWKLTITHAQPARIGTKATPPEIDITDGRDITISRRYRDGVIDWREIGLLLQTVGAIPVAVVEAHIEDDETVVAFDPAAKPGDEPVVVARTAAGFMWHDQPKAMADKLRREQITETLEREWATYEPKPRPEPLDSGWVRLTLPSDGLEMAACPDRMNEIPHDAHSWADGVSDGVLKIRDSKIWWCFGCDGPGDQVDSEKTPGALGG